MSETLEVGGLEAHLKGVVLPMGLRLDTLDLWGEGLRLQKTPFHIAATQPGRLEATVSESALAAFLESQSPGGLRNFVVRVGDERVHIQATKTMFIEVRANAVCRLRIDEGKRLFVDLESVEAMGMNPTALVQGQLDRINPVLDVRDLPVAAHLTSVQATGGKVLLKGTVDPR